MYKIIHLTLLNHHMKRGATHAPPFSIMPYPIVSLRFPLIWHSKVLCLFTYKAFCVFHFLILYSLIQLYFQQPVLSATTLSPDFLISHMSLSIVLSIISFVVYRLPLALTGCHYALILYMIVFLLCATYLSSVSWTLPVISFFSSLSWYIFTIYLGVLSVNPSGKIGSLLVKSVKKRNYSNNSSSLSSLNSGRSGNSFKLSNLKVSINSSVTS